MNSGGDHPQPICGRSAKVLIAEDSPLNQQVALRQLQKLGYQGDVVSNGAEVLEAVSQRSYHIILMDCQMPNMSGYEAACLIREREKSHGAHPSTRPHVYIIAMTANRKADSREKCRESGMDDFISKPVHLPELEAALRRSMVDRSGQQVLDEIIDPGIIAGLRQLRLPGEPDPLPELIDVFLKEAPVQLDSIEKSIADRNESSLARLLTAAVALTGSACNIGALNLAALCDEIERSARMGLLADALPVLDRARLEFNRVRDALLKIKTEG